jgi:hypothetical protein
MAVGHDGMEQKGFRVGPGGLVLATFVAIIGLAGIFAGPATPSSIVCTGVMTGEIDGNVIVPAGASCTLEAAHVNGNIRAEPGASSLSLLGDVVVRGNISDAPNTDVEIISEAPRGTNTIYGNVSSAVVICGAVVDGNVTMTGNTFEVALGGSESGAACQPVGGGNRISGNVSVTDNAPIFFRVADNQVGGNVTIKDTTGPATKRVLNNTVRHNLTCRDNDQPFVVAGNVAAKSVGQCAP